MYGYTNYVLARTAQNKGNAIPKKFFKILDNAKFLSKSLYPNVQYL
jgi:hypothetical protein